MYACRVEDVLITKTFISTSSSCILSLSKRGINEHENVTFIVKATSRKSHSPQNGRLDVGVNSEPSITSEKGSTERNTLTPPDGFPPFLRVSSAAG